MAPDGPRYADAASLPGSGDVLPARVEVVHVAVGDHHAAERPAGRRSRGRTPGCGRPGTAASTPWRTRPARTSSARPARPQRGLIEPGHVRGGDQRRDQPDHAGRVWSSRPGRLALRFRSHPRRFSIVVSNRVSRIGSRDHLLAKYAQDVGHRRSPGAAPRGAPVGDRLASGPVALSLGGQRSVARRQRLLNRDGLWTGGSGRGSLPAHLAAQITSRSGHWHVYACGRNVGLPDGRL